MQGHQNAVPLVECWVRAEDPVGGMAVPILGKPIMPSLTQEERHLVLESATNLPDKALITVLTDSALRLSEIAGVRARDIDWSATPSNSWAR